MNKWGFALVSFGSLLIMIAPTTNNQYPIIATGLMMVVIGLYLGLKKGK